MKNYFNILTCILSFLPISAYSQLAHSSVEIDSPSSAFEAFVDTEYHNDTSRIIVNNGVKNLTLMDSAHLIPSQDLYSTYKKFKDKKMDQVVSLMSKYGFRKQVMKTIQIVPSGSVDSLVLVRMDDSKIVFTRVDLGYLQCVKAYILLAVDDVTKQINRFEHLLKEDGYVLRNDRSVPSFYSEFQVTDEYWVIDKRWPQWTYTKFTSLYDFVLSRYGKDKFVVYFEETIPEKWVGRDQVPSEKLR